MSLKLFDPPSDSLGAFASETVITPPPDSPPALEPAFLRTPTPGDTPQSITALDEQPSQTVNVWLVATASVLLGILGGFAAGYSVAHRVFVPTVTSAPVPVPSATFQTARAERGTEPATAPSAVAPASPVAAPVRSTAASAASVSTASSPTRESQIAADSAPAERDNESRFPSRDNVGTPRDSRGTNPESRLSTIERGRPQVVSAASHAGAIEVLSHPQGAQVTLDGNVVGRAPLSIADVREGTHEIRLELAGFNPWVASVHVTGGNRARVGASLEK
jgi:hypothetical protein